MSVEEKEYECEKCGKGLNEDELFATCCDQFCEECHIKYLPSCGYVEEF